MSPDLLESLDYASKLNRAPSFIQELMADGERQAENFLNKKGRTTKLESDPSAVM